MPEEPRENQAPEQTDADQPQSEPDETGQSQEDQAPANQAEEPTEALTTEAPKENAAWAEMRVKNKQLAEEKAALEKALEDSGVDAEYLEQLKQATRSDAGTPQEVNVTPDTDLTQVTGAINQTYQTAANANREVSQLKNTLREMQDRQAEIEFPELKDDEVFQEWVAEKRFANEVMGKNVPTVEVARQVKKRLDYLRSRQSAQVEEQTKERIQQKQQATAQPQGTTSGGTSSAQDEELKRRIRKGDSEALAERNKELLGDLFD